MMLKSFLQTKAKKTKSINILSFLLLFILSSFVQAQTEETKKAELRIKQILNLSGKNFSEGLLALQDNRRDLARESFDKSVEEFLLSDVNVQTNEDLRLCYNELIETVYRMEFPTANEPVNIRRLSTICQWGIKNETADDIAKLVLPTNSATKGILNKSDIDANLMGFSNQEFEASPLDELSKLELTRDEEEVDKKSKPLVIKAMKTPDKKLKPLVSKAGKEPLQQKSGSVPVVLKYINETFHDPYTVKYLKWSKLYKVSVNGEVFWSVWLKFRAKNAFNAYRLSVLHFYIKDNKVTFSSEENLGSPVISSTRTTYSRPIRVEPTLTVAGIRVVKAITGDTVEKLAFRHKVKASDVAKLNGLFVKSKLNAGREIRIPVQSELETANPSTYSRPTSIQPTLTVAGIKVVKAISGDTVEKLAFRHKVKASDVAKLNGLFVKSKLNAGREIRIPILED